MSRILMEACRQAPGTPSEQGWLSRVAKSRVGYHHVLWTRDRSTPIGASAGAAESSLPLSWSEAHRAHLEAVRERANMGWPEAEPKSWNWTAQLGDRVDDEDPEQYHRPWVPTLYTPIPIAEVPVLLGLERYLLQRWREGLVLRVIAEGPHVFAVTADRQPYPLSDRTFLALQHWQFSRGDFEVEAVEKGYGLVLLDWVDPPGCARSALDRWQAIQTAILPAPLERELTAFSKPEKNALWQRALAEGWEGIILRRHSIAHVNGESAYDFSVEMWQETFYVVDQLLPKLRGRPRQLTVMFPTVDGSMVPLGPVCGRELSREDWRTLERFRDCHAGAVVRVRYTHWDPEAKRLMNGRVVEVLPRLSPADCQDAGAYLAAGTHYLF